MKLNLNYIVRNLGLFLGGDTLLNKVLGLFG